MFAEAYNNNNLTSIVGQIYVQSGFGIGFASYHFEENEQYYISYSAETSAELPVKKKYFINPVYTPVDRTLKATISQDGTSVEEYTMVFSSDF